MKPSNDTDRHAEGQKPSVKRITKSDQKNLEGNRSIDGSKWWSVVLGSRKNGSWNNF